MTNNPFADPDAQFDYGVKAGEIDLSKKPPVIASSRPPPAQAPISAAGTLDALAVCDADGTPMTKTQDGWIAYWNTVTDGRRFASAANIYQAGKTGDRTLLASLQKDFLESWIVTSTRIDYDQNTGVGKITHYYNSTLRTPSAKTIIIPEYNGETIERVVQNASGIQYLQTVFATPDTAETIMQTLEKLSGKTRSEIKIWTPDQASRKSIPQRAVRFSLDSAGFHVVGGNHVGGGGWALSRGAWVESPRSGRENVEEQST